MKAGIHLRASSRTCHFCSTGSFAKIAGNKLLIANGVMFSQIAIAVSLAAALRSGFFVAAMLIPNHQILNEAPISHDIHESTRFGGTDT